jgi:hypothetical protein
LDAVKAVEVGDHAGFGSHRLPRVVFGPPRGRGLLEGATHVYSLGHGGSITVSFRDNIVVDGPGADLAIYENAFHVGVETGPLFTEFGIVEVSADNRAWYRFPFDADTGAGLAGQAAVISNPANGEDPLAAASGGDRFDLADVGLEMIRFVRVIDGGDDLDDYGKPATVIGSVASSGTMVAGARVKLVPLDGSRKKRRRTGADGRFRFGRVLPVGIHELRVRKVGVGTAVEPIYIDLDQLFAEVDVTLAASQ